MSFASGAVVHLSWTTTFDTFRSLAHPFDSWNWCSAYWNSSPRRCWWPCSSSRRRVAEQAVETAMGPKLIGHHFVPYKGISDMHCFDSALELLEADIEANLDVGGCEAPRQPRRDRDRQLQEPKVSSPPRTAPTPGISVSISSPYPNPAIS